MGKLVEEVREWQTPIVGTYLLWRFTKSFVENHPNGDAPVVILHYIVNTLINSTEYSDPINGHRSNIASYIRSFTDDNKSDLLAGLAQRIYKQRESSMKAIDIAVAAGFLAWDTETAKIYPLNNFKPARGSNTKGISIQSLGKKADILGKWFSNTDLQTVVSSLGVIL
jgi:hypothetical protein